MYEPAYNISSMIDLTSDGGNVMLEVPDIVELSK